MVRPFRFGVSTSSAGSPEEWRDRAIRAEELGYDTFHVADHLVSHYAPFVALAFAAEATKRITLGTFVINNDFRHPVLLAREAATLHALSGGRFELGIGAGHSKDEYDEAGIPFDEGPVRVARLGEAVEVIRRLLAGGKASFEGEHYRVSGHELAPAPPTKLPLLVGGNAKSLLEMAARKADIIGFTGIFLGPDGSGVDFRRFTLEGLRDRLSIVTEAAGKRMGELELNILVQGVTVTDDRGAVISATQERIPALTADEIRDCPFLLIGSVDEMVDRLQELRATTGISYISTHWPGMEPLAPVVARLSGK